jgi:sec-independent protein translocase protein TatA
MNSLSFPIAAFGLGGSELLLILAIVVLLFGGAKLPELARGLGKSIKEFKKASAEGEGDSADSSDKKAVAKPEATKTHGSN